jgi:eukaryotic-like serine/threonine-protein kinase
MRCPKCGTDTPPPATACLTCGTLLPGSFVSSSDSETTMMETGTGPALPRARGGPGPLVVGEPFGARYRIQRELGAGGMGVVYQAWDEDLGVPVALKVIRTAPDTDPNRTRDFERRFKRELLLARQVTHNNVIRIYDLGDINGIKYITMSYVEGADLATIIQREGTLPTARALRIARGVVAGLRAAHAAGVVHRDLKPANIMIDEQDEARIMDFGIARSASLPPDSPGAPKPVDLRKQGALETATMEGGIVGTVQYMAPEQGRGEEVDQRADIYSLGLIMYDMLGGAGRATRANSVLGELTARMEQAPPGIRTRNPFVPEALARVIARCLEPAAKNRYATTRELEADLQRLDDEGNLLPVLRRFTTRQIVAAAIVIAILLTGTWWFSRTPVAPPAPAPVSVVIADFENRTNEPSFEGTVEQALGIAMEGASFVTSYNRQQARRLASTMRLDGALTEANARLVANREGIKVVLSGAMTPSGSGYQITVKAIDPEKGAQLAERSITARSKAELLPAISAVAGEIRSALGDTTPESTRRQAGETFTAGSLPAMAAYARAQELNNTAGKTQEALAKFNEAVQHDPEFGRAYINIATIYTNLKQPEEAQKNYDKAIKYIDRMTEREKYRTLGTYYLGVARDYEKAIANYQELVKLYPADNTGTANLALAYVYVRNLPMAAEMGRRAIEIYPKSVLQRTNYATYSMYSGDFATAVDQAQKALKENPAYEWAALTLALSRLSQGDEARARAAYTSLKAMSPLGFSLSTMGEADLEMYYGHVDRARAVLKDGIARDQETKDDSNLALKLIALSELELAAGRRKEAGAAAERAAGLNTHESVLVPAARMFVALGKEDRAREIARGLDALIPPAPRSYARVIAADIALSHGRFPEAIDDLREAIKLHDSWLAHVVLGKVYAAAKRPIEALGEWEACLKRRGEATDVFFADTSSLRYLPEVYFYLGLAQEAGGAASGARSSFESFLKMRGAAQPPDPLAADAQRRLAKPGS